MGLEKEVELRLERLGQRLGKRVEVVLVNEARRRGASSTTAPAG